MDIQHILGDTYDMTAFWFSDITSVSIGEANIARTSWIDIVVRQREISHFFNSMNHVFQLKQEKHFLPSFTNYAPLVFKDIDLSVKNIRL